MDAVEREYLRIRTMLAAGEDWAAVYKKDPKSHAKLITLEAKWQLIMSKFFKELSNKATSMINVGAYYSQVTADYDIEVIINDQPFDDADSSFITVSLDTVTQIVGTGALSGQNTYNMPLGISPASANIQKLGLKQVAGLVGKTINKDGTVVDNPKAAYNITDTVRNDVAQSIKTSLALGENINDATARIQRVIADPMRAERIARTESVNAYQSGLAEFADQSNAVGKEWQDAGASDECADNTAVGPISIDDTFPSGDSEPTAHPNCRCGIRYIYQKEWDSL